MSPSGILEVLFWKAKDVISTREKKTKKKKQQKTIHKFYLIIKAQDQWGGQFGDAREKLSMSFLSGKSPMFLSEYI